MNCSFCTCRQIDGCDNRVHECIHGSNGFATTQHGTSIEGANPWRFEGDNPKTGVDTRDFVDELRPMLTDGNRVAR